MKSREDLTRELAGALRELRIGDQTIARLEAENESLRAEIGRLREPRRELLCQMCGRDYPVWSADNDLWNAVMRHDGRDEYPFVCPTCFTVRAAFLGVAHSFQLTSGAPDDSE